MLSVNLKDVRPGMIPSQDVRDRTGRVLIEAGKEITSKHMKVLKAWGVPEIKIVKEGALEEKREGAAGKVQVSNKIEKEMLELFRHADRRHPAIRELFNLCSLRKANS